MVWKHEDPICQVKTGEKIMNNDVKVQMIDVHQCGMCSRGAATKLRLLGFERDRIRDILRNGISVDEVRSLGDAQFDLLADNAIKRYKEAENG